MEEQGSSTPAHAAAQAAKQGAGSLSAASASNEEGAAIDAGAVADAHNAHEAGSGRKSLSSETAQEEPHSTEETSKKIAAVVSRSRSLKKQMYQRQLEQTEQQLQEKLRQLKYVTNLKNKVAEAPVVFDGKFKL